MSIQLPAPVAAYQLPDGTFVGSAEEYAARCADGNSSARAKAYVEANRAAFARGQDTRAFNQIKEFLNWEAGQALIQSAQAA